MIKTLSSIDNGGFDDCQQHLHDNLGMARVSAMTLGRNRAEEISSIPVLDERLAADMSKRTRQFLDDFAIILRKAKSSVCDLAPSTGTIRQEDAAEYVRQELLREELLSSIRDWVRRFQLHLHDMDSKMHGYAPDLHEEFHLAIDAYRMLDAHYFSLSDLEEIERSLLILREILKERNSMFQTLLMAPVGNLRQISITTITTFAALGSGTLALLTGVTSTGAQWAYKYGCNSSRSAKLDAPEQYSRCVVSVGLDRHRHETITKMGELGLFDYPETYGMSDYPVTRINGFEEQPQLCLDDSENFSHLLSSPNTRLESRSA